MATLKTATPNKFSYRDASRALARLSPFGVFGLTLLVYLATCAPGLTWQNGGDDGGDLATAAKLLGIAHPTGYPLYLLLAQPLLWLGLEPAYALNLMSAFYGALACALLTASLTELLRLGFPSQSDQAKTFEANLREWAGGTSAGLLLAFSPLFWSQAVIAEVYSFEALLLAYCLWTLVRWYRIQSTSPANQKRGLGLVLLAAGLGAAHHRTGFLSLVAFGAFVIVGLGGWRKSLEFVKKLNFRLWLAGSGLFLAPFLFYLYILVRGGKAPAANWLNPGFNNLSGFWDEFNATFYHNLLFAAPTSQALGRISASVQLLVAQFGVWGVALGLAGWWAAWDLPKLRPFFWLALTGIILQVGFAAIYAADNSQVYLLPAFVLWAALIGIGLTYLLTEMAGLWPKSDFAWLEIGSVLVLMALALVLNFGTTNVSQDKTAATWAASSFANATPDAVLVTNEDKYTFGLWYEEYALDKRPDIILIESRLLGFDWYRANLQRLYPTLNLNALMTGDTSANLNALIGANPTLHFFNATLNGLQAIS